jgi:signal transduction histidine kinase
VQTRAIARDMSELKKAERELEKVNRTLKALSEFNNALLHITDAKNLLNEICRIIVDTAGYKMAWVGYVEFDEDKSIKPEAYGGLNHNYLETSQFTWNDKEPDQDPSGRAVCSKNIYVIKDIGLDSSNGIWRTGAVRRGFNSLLAIPLSEDERIIGVLTIYSSETDCFNEEEINLLRKLAENLSYGLKVFRTNEERKLAQSEIIRTSHLASIGELAAGVAHEINNPINGIINYAQILSNKSPLGTSERDISSRIIKEGNRIAMIVSNLLSFACERKGGKVPANISDVLSNGIALTETQLKKDRIKIMVNIPPVIPTVAAQPQQLEQVFLNILSNSRYALNHKYEGEFDNKIIDIKVKTVSIKDKSFMQIVIFDNGIGIPQNIMNKIMNPFFSTKPSNVGTGLGLSISHGIISDHSGKLYVDSKENEYTKVVIELPVYTRLVSGEKSISGSLTESCRQDPKQ